MLSVTIDTAVFAPPAPGSSTEVVYGFIETLLAWRDALDHEHTNVYTSRRAAEVLMNEHLYPIRPQLGQLLKQADISEYDANTVAILAETLLGRSQKLEEVLRISDVLVEGLTIEPDVFSSHRSVPLQEEAQRCAVIVSLASQYCDEPLVRQPGIGVCSRQQSTSIKVSGMLQVVDHERDDMASLPMDPNRFEGTTFACSSLHDFLIGLDDAAMLRAAADIVDVRIAIMVALYKRDRAAGRDPKWEDLPQFRVGSQFVASLRAQNIVGNVPLARSVIRSAVETIVHESMADTHWLREGPGPNERQKKRGKDAAWRRDIDYEYHLHYWECGNGIVELASVVVHNDFSIPE